MEIWILLAAPLFAIAIHAVLGKRPGVLQGLSVGFAVLSLYAAYRGMTTGLRVDNVFVPLWSNFIVAPSFYISPLNAPLIALTGLAVAFAVLLLDAWHDANLRYTASLWVLVLGLTGTFLSDSIVLFYVFFETALMGAYFWIGFYGRKNAEGGADSRPGLTRFFLFTLVGSLSMLVSIAFLCSGGKDVRFSELPALLGDYSPGVRRLVVLGFLAAFAVKMPLFGLHGWLRETYTSAPPAARAILSAVMSKLGAFGLLLMSLHMGSAFQEMAPFIAVVAAAGVVYGGLVSLSRKTVLDAAIYSSLCHLNLIALGLAVFNGTSGDASIAAAAVLQMFNHGLVMAAVLVYDARVQSESAAGLREHARRLSMMLLFALFAAISLPGLSSFPAEVILLYASFKFSPYVAAAAALGLLLAAAALIRIYHRHYVGAFKGQAEAVARGELSMKDILPGVIFAALWIVLGLWPGLLLSPIAAALGMVKP
jgi:NADH-quinone oxidoreductase subunit M